MDYSECTKESQLLCAEEIHSYSESLDRAWKAIWQGRAEYQDPQMLRQKLAAHVYCNFREQGFENPYHNSTLWKIERTWTGNDEVERDGICWEEN